MNVVKLVFEEHICRINHKETSMTLSTTIKIWHETSPALYLPRMASSEVAMALYLFAQPRFKPIREGGGNFHSCNKTLYITANCKLKVSKRLTTRMGIGLLPVLLIVYLLLHEDGILQ